MQHVIITIHVLTYHAILVHISRAKSEEHDTKVETVWYVASIAVGATVRQEAYLISLISIAGSVAL